MKTRGWTCDDGRGDRCGRLHETEAGAMKHLLGDEEKLRARGLKNWRSICEVRDDDRLYWGGAPWTHEVQGNHVAFQAVG
jgi:hypothetical protein